MRFRKKMLYGLALFNNLQTKDNPSYSQDLSTKCAA